MIHIHNESNVDNLYSHELVDWVLTDIRDHADIATKTFYYWKAEYFEASVRHFWWGANLSLSQVVWMRDCLLVIPSNNHCIEDTPIVHQTDQQLVSYSLLVLDDREMDH